MRGVNWSFATAPSPDVGMFAAAVSEAQQPGRQWTPDERIPAHGQIEIEFVQYHNDDDETEKVFVLDSPADGQWTHATLLYSIHRHLHANESFGDTAYFEGLVTRGPARYRLMLGS